MIGTIGMIIIPIMGIFGQVGRGKGKRRLTGFHLSHVTSAWVSAFLKHAITVSTSSSLSPLSSSSRSLSVWFFWLSSRLSTNVIFWVNQGLIASLSNTIWPVHWQAKQYLVTTLLHRLPCILHWWLHTRAQFQNFIPLDQIRRALLPMPIASVIALVAYAYCLGDCLCLKPGWPPYWIGHWLVAVSSVHLPIAFVAYTYCLGDFLAYCTYLLRWSPMPIAWVTAYWIGHWHDISLGLAQSNAIVTAAGSY